MARRRKKQTGFEFWIMAVAKLPWWGCLLMAVISYSLLHLLSETNPVAPTSTNQLSHSILPIFIRAIGSIGQYLAPLICVLAAGMSFLNSINRNGSNSVKPLASIQSRGKVKSPRFDNEDNPDTGFAKDESNIADAYIPLCPRCGAHMVWRIAKRGENAGKSFWGCPSFPRCRGIITIE